MLVSIDQYIYIYTFVFKMMVSIQTRTSWLMLAVMTMIHGG